MTTHPSSPVSKPRIALELKLSNDWPKVELVRSAVLGFVQATMVPGELVESLSTASAELLENALKFSPATHLRSHRPVSFLLESDEDETRVIVTNAVEEDSPHLERLREALAILRSTDDVDELYRQRLEAVYRGEAEAGVGLVRIGKMGFTLEHHVEGNENRMVARFSSASLPS